MTNISTEIMNQAKELMNSTDSKVGILSPEGDDTLSTMTSVVNNDNFNIDGVSLYPVPTTTLKEYMNEKFGKNIEHNSDSDSDSDSEPDSDTEEYAEYWEQKRYEQYEDDEDIRRRKLKYSEKEYSITVALADCEGDCFLLCDGKKLPICSEESINFYNLFIKYSTDYVGFFIDCDSKSSDCHDYSEYLYYNNPECKIGYERYQRYLIKISLLDDKVSDKISYWKSDRMGIPDEINQEIYLLIEDKKFLKDILEEATTIWWISQKLEKWTDERRKKFSKYEPDILCIISKCDDYIYGFLENYRDPGRDNNIFDYFRYLLYRSNSYRRGYLNYKQFLAGMKYLLDAIVPISPNYQKNVTYSSGTKETCQAILIEDEDIKRYINRLK